MKKLFLITVVIAASYLMISQSDLKEKLIYLSPSYQFERLDKNMADNVKNNVNNQFLALKTELQAELQSEQQAAKWLWQQHAEQLSAKVALLTTQLDNLIAQPAVSPQLNTKSTQALTQKLSQATVNEKNRPINQTVNFTHTAVNDTNEHTVKVTPLSSSPEFMADADMTTNHVGDEAKNDLSESISVDKKLKLQSIIERMEQQSLQLLAAK